VKSSLEKLNPLAQFFVGTLRVFVFAQLIFTLEWFAAEMSKTYRIRLRHGESKIAPWTVEVFKGWYCLEVSQSFTKAGAIRKGRKVLRNVHAPSWQIEEVNDRN
jgi:hypothetical protein